MLFRSVLLWGGLSLIHLFDLRQVSISNLMKSKIQTGLPSYVDPFCILQLEKIASYVRLNLLIFSFRGEWSYQPDLQ